MQYNIFSLINIVTDKTNFESDSWRKFIQENYYKKCDIYITQIKGTILYESISYVNLENIQHILCYQNTFIIGNSDWSYIQIPLQNPKMNTDVLIRKAVYSYTISMKFKIIQLHSSLIRFNNHGLMFLGPSGIGKTTQAELWNKYRDALIINGDIVFVQETENAFLGWGTPWHGSSPYCENTSVPVHAMIVLKQATENSIRELSGFEKVTAVSNSVFYPQWLENGMELCLETLDHLLSSVPVYELSCRPDEDAVRITEEAVFGGRL